MCLNMPFTDKSDLYGALNEDGVNNVATHIMRQRPSLFNYGTALVAANPELHCEKIEATPDVIYRGNPLMTVEDPLPVLGTDGAVALNFCFQLTKAKIDFHPGDVVTLPPELSPPLAKQSFAVYIRVCGALGCPTKEELEKIPPPPPPQQEKEPRPPEPPIVPIPRKLECFCLDLYVTGHVEVTGPTGDQKLTAKVDGMEIVDIKPEGLENNIECYLNMVLQLVILPRTSVALETMVFDIMNMVSLTLTPTPTSTTLPNNPAIEDDQLKVYIDMGVTP
jgi:hypothetical protein